MAAQRTTAIARAQQAYGAALDAVERSAIAAGQLQVAAAIKRERDGMLAHSLPAASPIDLAKNLQTSRRTYIESVRQTTTAAETQQQRIDADYLRDLTTLAGRTRGNPALTKQIEDEKGRLLASITPENPKPALATIGSANAILTSPLVNGDFSQLDSNGAPTGWGNFANAEMRKEKDNTFIRFKIEPAKQGRAILNQGIRIPENAKTVTGRIRVRIENYKLPGGKGPAFGLQFRDTGAKGFTSPTVPLDRNTGWRKFETTRTLIPSGATKILVEFGPYGATGTFDFDDVDVEFQ